MMSGICGVCHASDPDNSWDDRFYCNEFAQGYGINAISATDDGAFYAAGNFYSFGGRPIRTLARWDGRTWQEPPVPLQLNTAGPATGRVNVLASRGNDLFVGGRGINRAGDVELRNVALWNGAAWSGLGGGVDGEVTALAVNGSRVYVAGSFRQAGGITATNIACWDGSDWTAMGDGLPFAASALAIHLGELYAGGMAGAAAQGYNGIARWTGTNWVPVGGGVSGMVSGLQPNVRTMLSFQNQLLAGGVFSMAGSTAVTNIASWDGTRWSACGYGLNKTAGITALTSWQDRMLAGAKYVTPDTNGISLVQFDGAQWQPMAGHPFVTNVTSIVTQGGSIYAMGQIRDATGTGASGFSLAHFDGARWQVMGQGFPRDTVSPPTRINAVAVTASGVAAGGSFAGAAALWRDSNWESFGNTFRMPNSGGAAEIFAIAAQGGSVWFGGNFGRTANSKYPFITSFDGTNWFESPKRLDTIRALSVAGARVLAGGDSGLAQWKNGQWSSPGLGPEIAVRAIADDGDVVYAGGVSSRTANNTGQIMRWDGGQWTYLAINLDGAVESLAVFDGMLYAGGKFKTIGGIPVNHIAAWDGSDWHDVGGGLGGGNPTDTVSALAADGGGRIFAGGVFNAGEAANITNLAYYQNGRWQSLGPVTGGNAHVNTLAWNRGNLYVGGDFFEAGGKPAASFSIWHDPAARAALTVRTPETVPPGGDATVIVTVENMTANRIANATVRLPLPSGTTYIGSGQGGVWSSNAATWSFDSLPPGLTNLECNISVPVIPRTMVFRNVSIQLSGEPAAFGAPAFLTIDDGIAAPRVELLSPTNTMQFTAPARIDLSADAVNPGDNLDRVEFYAGTNRIASVSEAPWHAIWEQAPAGTNAIRAVAFDRQGRSTCSLPAVITIFDRPANDNFASRLVLTNGSQTVAGTTLNATSETGEPTQDRYSVWYEWRPPTDGIAIISIDQAYPDLSLAVLSGTALSNLSAITVQSHYATSAPFVVKSANTYILLAAQTSVYTQGPFLFQLDLKALPANDDFTHAFVISGLEYTNYVNTLGATAQPGEPDHGGAPAEESLWWKWTAHASGRIAITTGPYIRAGLYTGGALETLKAVPVRTQNPMQPPTAPDFNVVEGVTYYVAVDKGAERTGAFGFYFNPQGGRFRTIAASPEGKLRFEFIGWAFTDYIMESSTNLDTWTPLWTNRTENIWTSFELAPNPSRSKEFWRSRLSP